MTDDLKSMKNKSSRILVVSDSVRNNYQLHQILINMAYYVYPAFSEEDAINMLWYDSPDLIILEMLNNEASEVRTLENLKNSERVNGTPIIMISSVNDPVYIQKALRLGAADFIIRPLQEDTLLKKVGMAINSYYSTW